MLHYKNYRQINVQELSAADKVLRCECANNFRLKLPPNLQNVIFTDECSLYTDGSGNNWNTRKWSSHQPKNFTKQKFQNASKITVLAGITTRHLFGPYFYPGNVSAQSYCHIITNFLWPDINQTLGDVVNNIWFMQDGASAHTAILSRRLLSDYFGDRIIGKHFSVDWPQRSPDISPCDYFLWGYIKVRLYCGNVFASVEQLSNELMNLICFALILTFLIMLSCLFGID